MAIEPNDKSLFSLPNMVGWFNPQLLANAAIRAAISPVFGTYADARASQATIDGFKPEELTFAASRHLLADADVISNDGAVWVDYLADTGDGFDSTYAMASLVAADTLEVARAGSTIKHKLPTGRVFVLGGDQVYPYPSREEYDRRFVYPFRMAFSAPSQARLTFVIPGNHDWYDGLNSFDFLFCQARFGIDRVGETIGNLHFTQHRSYFATRLPNNWWIWGADIQFSQYLDVGQVRYFQAVADIMLNRSPGEPEHKVILCIAEPGWQYENEAARAANSNISIVTGIADRAGAKVCAVLSGDTHHYCRYYSKELGLNLITAGGGGAFLHPTHQLYKSISFNWLGTPHEFDMRCKPTPEGAPAQGASAWPSRGASIWMTFWNAMFPVFNYTFAILLGIFYWLMTWMYAQTAVARQECLIRPEGSRDFVIVSRPLIEDILFHGNARTCGLKGDGVIAQAQDLIGISINAAIANFLLGIFVIALLVACISYADARRFWKRMIMGTMHWLAHITAMIVLYIVVSRIGTPFGGQLAELAKPYLFGFHTLLQTVTYMTLMIFGGGAVAGLVWGCYLLISCALFKRHWNDAFSALRLADYKNFLRMKIDGEVLTIYPIGLKRSPLRIGWQRQGGQANARYEPRIALSPELIDGPIVIDARQVRMRVEPVARTAGGQLT
ncbi:MAG: hypothetical protein ACKVP7_19090 [Hyphomicrobiaceae bacterium]